MLARMQRTPAASAGRGLLMRLAIGVAVLAAVEPGVSCFKLPDGQDSEIEQTLACARSALGGGDQLSRVTSLVVTLETSPLTSGGGVVASDRQIVIIQPDRYLNTAKARQPIGREELQLSSIVGFDRDVLLTGSRVGADFRAPDDLAASIQQAREEFSRYLLAWLLAQSPVLSTRVEGGGTQLDRGTERLVIEARGTGGYNTRLLLDRESCRPVSLIYERPANYGDLRREQALGLTVSEEADLRTVRVDLEDHRRFAGILFPAMMRTSIDDVPFRADRVVDVQLNTEQAATYFNGSR